MRFTPITGTLAVAMAAVWFGVATAHAQTSSPVPPGDRSTSWERLGQQKRETQLSALRELLATPASRAKALAQTARYAPTQKELDELIRGLGAERHALREASYERLLLLGHQDHIKQFRKAWMATRDDEAEKRQRLRMLLGKACLTPYDVDDERRLMNVMTVWDQLDPKGQHLDILARLRSWGPSLWVSNYAGFRLDVEYERHVQALLNSVTGDPDASRAERILAELRTLGKKYHLRGLGALEGVTATDVELARKQLDCFSWRTRRIVLKAKQGIAITLVLVPPGKGVMGSPSFANFTDRHEWPLRTVTIKDGFYISDTEISREVYREVLGDEPPVGKDSKLPTEDATWHDASAFCKKLSSRLVDWKARLPYETEWEYACRAGTSSNFCYGDAIDTGLANVAGTTLASVYPWSRPGKGRESLTEVGYFLPNGYGMYDVHGNVSEWVADRYDPDWYRLRPAGVLHGPKAGELRVRRGGAYGRLAHGCRSAERMPVHHDSPEGFRVLLERSEHSK